MTNPTLVTGGTGRLGSALVSRLVSAGHAVRVLSRSPRPAGAGGPDWTVGDLLTGDGLDEALTAVGTVIHCATGNDPTDVTATRSLTAAALRAGRPHLIYVSIVGVDRVSLPYYRAKLESERLVEDSGLPWTVQRTTQFHDLVAWMSSVQRWLPAILMPSGVSFQPIDVGEVADRLSSLAHAEPQGRADDMGGPEVRTATDLARSWARAHGRRRPVLAVPAPGAAFRAYRQGAHLAPGHAVGRITFEQYLTATAPYPGRLG
ncbi:SDR family oxidoreductase [Streptomyces rubiginosohelvolus]|uniref:SDR family oxidoreductase n=1 Tax=Streptomyces rubiginosohelvolus TaxID=67362 RepID=UPI003693D212